MEDSLVIDYPFDYLDSQDDLRSKTTKYYDWCQDSIDTVIPTDKRNHIEVHGDKHTAYVSQVDEQLDGEFIMVYDKHKPAKPMFE